MKYITAATGFPGAAVLLIEKLRRFCGGNKERAEWSKGCLAEKI